MAAAMSQAQAGVVRGFARPAHRRRPGQRRALRVAASDQEGSDAPASSSSGGGGGAEPGLGLKAAWYAAEQFGNVIGLSKGGTSAPPGGGGASAGAAVDSAAALPRAAVLESIRADYDANYFVGGTRQDGAMLEVYAPDCEFADPFVSFRGTDRFLTNVGNLGGLMQDVQLDVYGWEELPDSLRTKWRFSATLDLPWRPRLAAGGATTHVFDPASGRVVRHVEEWDVEPGRVLRALLKPSSRVPTSRWEVVMDSVHGGDAGGVWRALAGGVLRLAAAAGAGSAVLALALGDAAPAAVHPIGWLSLALIIVAATTEVTNLLGGTSKRGEL